MVEEHELGSSGRAPHAAPPRGSANTFIIDDEELGELFEATIGHDNTGYSASWHMDHMAITNTKTQQRFTFPCRCVGLGACDGGSGH